MNARYMLSLIAVIVLFAFLAASCSQYVCPAYSTDDTAEQHDEERA